MTLNRTSLIALLMLLIARQATAETSSQRRFLEGLRERGLFELAETYCVERLQKPNLSDPQRADLVVELAKSVADQAVASPPAARPALWKRAEGVCQEFADKYPQNPHLLLVEFQSALGLLTRGELARQESSLVADKARLIEEAKNSLHTAIARMRSVSERAERRIQELGLGGRKMPGDLDAVELAALKTNISYQLARALMNQAQCYPADSDDRSHALSQAVALLDPLAKLEPSHPLTWKSRLHLARCYRLLGDPAATRRQLGAIMTQDPPDDVRLKVRVERIRLALGADNLPDALAVVGMGRSIDRLTSPELDYAWLETYLAAWRLASKQDGGEAQAEHWKEKAKTMVATIDQLYGPYWTRRAEMLLAGYVRAAPGSGDLTMLVRAAESSFRSGRPEEAIAAYGRAADFAIENDNKEKAFELLYTAAAIEHQRQRHAQASQAFAALAKRLPDNPKAPEANLLAIYHAAQVARKKGDKELAAYETMLRNHLQTWPKGPVADRVRRRLGKLYEYRKDWARAIEAYMGISPSDADFIADASAVDACTKRLIAERKAAGEPTKQIATDAAAWFESLIVDEGGQLPERWSPLHRFAALAAARMLLDYGEDYDRAQRILSSAFQGATDAPAEWKSTAQALLVYSLAGEGRIAEAGEVLGGMSDGPPQELLTLLEGLGRVGANTSERVRGQLAGLQLKAVDLMRKDGQRLDDAAQRRLEKINAQALAAAGKTSDALRAYESLHKQYPRDAEIHEAYAALLGEQSDRRSVENSLAKWRELEKHSDAGGDRWFRAKYAEALLHYRLGDRKQAAKIITLLKLMHPNLGGPEMKGKFEALLLKAKG